MMTGENDEAGLSIQADIFNELLRKEKVGESDITRFILENAPLFSYFSQHLTPELSEIWVKARTDKQYIPVIEQHYLEFREGVEKLIELMDPDSRSALTDAAESGDIDTASKILESYLRIREASEKQQ